MLSSETSVIEKATLRNIPENDILHTHRHESLKVNFPVRYELGFISEKTTCFIVTAVETSNLT
jgi:hypothetical protein